MLFAEADGVAWLGYVITGVIALVGVLVVSAGLLVAYFTNSKTTLDRLNAQQVQLFKLEDEIRVSRRAEADCKDREADLKTEVALIGARTKALESATGTAPPPPVAGIVVADLRGVIREFSPALTPILGFLSKEMVGKRLGVLVPPEMAEGHCLAAVPDPESLDPAREFLTHVLARDGKRVPAGITLHGWKADGSEGLITATIRQRVPTTRLVVDPPAGGA